ncbi:MAG: hypothetical protein WDN08_01290 [Rhizomicrobium sp.]
MSDNERNEIDATAYFASLRRSLGIDLTDAQFLDGWNALFVRPIPEFGEELARFAGRLPVLCLHQHQSGARGTIGRASRTD